MFSGIGAASTWIEEQVREVLAFNGITVGKRHLRILAKTMTLRGVLPFNRHGILKLNKSFLAQCAFETTADVLERAAQTAANDPLIGVTENGVVGNAVEMGSAMTMLKIDPMESVLCSTELDHLIHENSKTIRKRRLYSYPQSLDRWIISSIGTNPKSYQPNASFRALISAGYLSNGRLYSDDARKTNFLYAQNDASLHAYSTPLDARLLSTSHSITPSIVRPWPLDHQTLPLLKSLPSLPSRCAISFPTLENETNDSFALLNPDGSSRLFTSKRTMYINGIHLNRFLPTFKNRSSGTVKTNTENKSDANSSSSSSSCLTENKGEDDININCISYCLDKMGISVKSDSFLTGPSSLELFLEQLPSMNQARLNKTHYANIQMTQNHSFIMSGKNAQPSASSSSNAETNDGVEFTENKENNNENKVNLEYLRTFAKVFQPSSPRWSNNVEPEWHLSDWFHLFPNSRNLPLSESTIQSQQCAIQSNMTTIPDEESCDSYSSFSKPTQTLNPFSHSISVSSSSSLCLTCKRRSCKPKEKYCLDCSREHRKNVQAQKRFCFFFLFCLHICLFVVILQKKMKQKKNMVYVILLFVF